MAFVKENVPAAFFADACYEIHCCVGVGFEVLGGELELDAVGEGGIGSL